MKVAVYSSNQYVQQYLSEANKNKHELIFIKEKLKVTSLSFALNCKAICVFVNDNVSEDNLKILKKSGVEFIAIRSAGYNNINITAAHKFNMKAARVPAYSPHAIAEHAVALMLALNRKLIRAHQRILQNNFSHEGQLGFNMRGKTVGIMGTGKIGSAVAEILNGFGCVLLASDQCENELLKKNLNVKYTDLKTLCSKSDIITLHVPLTPETTYLVNKDLISHMKTGAMLINTSRGKVINTSHVIEELKSGKIGALGIDVYENEGPLFFEDHSEELLKDDLFARLLAFQNVIITGHQAFLTAEALKNIAVTTIENIDCFEKGTINENFL